MPLTPGTSATFALTNSGGNWWASYNNTRFGYFPGSLWHGRFTTAQIISAFGEVSADSQPSCTQMGNGAYGSTTGSSWISNYRLYGTHASPHLTITASDPSYYNYGAVTPTSFHLGGPGTC